MVIQFKLKPVKFLWSPNGKNEAWRLTTKPSVIEFKQHDLASGRNWHQYCDLLRLKYGTNWAHTWGFDFDLCTEAELSTLQTFYSTAMYARGITSVRMPKDWPDYKRIEQHGKESA